MSNRRFVMSLVTSIAFTITACDPDISGVPRDQPKIPRAEQAFLTQAKLTRGIREDFRDMSKEVPGFTGVFRDESGNVVIAATRELSQGERAKVLAWAHARQYLSGNTTTSEVSARHVPFDYASLYDAFIGLRTAIGKSGALTSARIDETTGQIVMGVYPKSDILGLSTSARSLGIPDNMVRWERQEPVVLTASLSDIIRPIAAGLEILRPSGGACSLGPLGWKFDPGTGAIDYSILFGMTASHCTSSRYAVQGDVFGQPNPSNPIGVEVDEAPIWTGGTCPYTSCQNADVAVIKINADVAGYGQYAAVSTRVSAAPAPF